MSDRTQYLVGVCVMFAGLAIAEAWAFLPGFAIAVAAWIYIFLWPRSGDRGVS